MIVPLSKEQKQQLGGWLTREKDYLLSIQSMCKAIVFPGVTGLLELATNDLDTVYRLRTALRTEGDPDLMLEDVEVLIEIAAGNKFPDKKEFWQGIQAAISAAREMETHSS